MRFRWTIHKCAEPSCDQIATTPQQHYWCIERGHRAGTVPVLVEPVKDRPSDEPVTPKASSGQRSTAKAMSEPRRGSQRDRIVRSMFSYEERTAEQIAARTGLPLNSVSTRLSELVEGGWMEVVDESGVTSHGAACSRYSLTDKAVRWKRAA